jgi:hypothetical protein
MNHSLTLSASVLLCAAATGQVTMQPTLVAPHTTAAIAGSSSNAAISILPTDTISAAAGAGDVVTMLQCTTMLNAGEVGYSAKHEFIISPSAATPAIGTCNTDVRLDLVAQTTTAVRFTIEAAFAAPAGVPAPTVRIDLGDDGVIEFGGLIGQTFMTTLPPGTLPIRFQATTTSSAAGISTLDLSLRIAPANTLFTSQVVGCDFLNLDTFAAQARLDGGIGFSAFSTAPDPLVLVLGLSAFPLILPPMGALPCVLWPSPDILVPMPNLGSGPSQFVVPLPPVLRPITFHAQAVRVTASGLQTTNALRVDSN